MMTLQAWISAKHPGETQAFIAERLGLSRPYLSQILNEQRTPGSAAQLKINNATGGIVCPNSWIPIITLPVEDDDDEGPPP